MRIEVLRGAGLNFHHDKSGVHSSTDQGDGKRRDAGIKIPDLGQCAGFAGADDVVMQGLPENVPTAANSFVIFVVLCLFILGGIAFAKFMQNREAKRRGD